MLISHIFESFTIDDTDPSALYSVFQGSYERATGASWDERKFRSRAQNWTFYGDEKGFVAVRQQRSGMKKLVAVAGERASIQKGMAELSAQGGPIWGAVTDQMARASKRYGFIAPHTYPGGPTFIKMLVRLIPAEVFGAHTVTVANDGGIQIEYGDVGQTTKYLIGNPAYFAFLTGMPQARDALAKVPGLGAFLRLIGVKPQVNEVFGWFRDRAKQKADDEEALRSRMRDFRDSNEPVPLDPPARKPKTTLPPAGPAPKRPAAPPEQPMDADTQRLLAQARRSASRREFIQTATTIHPLNTDPDWMHDRAEREYNNLVRLWDKWKAAGWLPQARD